MKHKSFLTIASLLVVMLGSCGYKTPVPNSSKELLEMDPSTTWIRGRDLSDEDILYLSRIKGAQYLDFCGGWGSGPLKMTDAGFENLKNVSCQLENLKTLYICHADHITDRAVAQIAEMCYVKSLCIENCPLLTDDTLRYLSSARNIKYIGLDRCPGITNKGFECLSKNSLINDVHIENFSLAQLDNRCLQSLQKMPNLKTVSFIDTPFLDTNSMSILAEFGDLRELTISAEGCLNFSDNSLKALSGSLTIEELIITMNDNMTFTGITYLADIKKLRKLHLHNVRGKPFQQLKDFHRILPSCEVTCTNEAGVYVYKYKGRKEPVASNRFK
jgi:hypothetical protein